MSIIKLSKWAKENGYTYKGALARYKRGDLKGSFKTETGMIFVKEEDIKEEKQEKTAIYARVSSNKQKDDLLRQVERLENYCMANGKRIDVITKEIGSGLNDSRNKLMDLLLDKEITTIVIEHKDRLTRFGFNYINKLSDKEIIVANPAKEDKEDLMQDLISVITSMAARYYGKRKSRQKTTEIIKNL